MKYTIESRRDRLVVVRDARGLSIVVGSLSDAHRFDTPQQARIAFSALQFKHNNLHSGFKIYEVQS
ncbi:hypothetical protein SAMN05660964_03563 [Thiothrix caldifontis]|uniref:Uncharacterized protein n=1 Tax=Thiothrix caldifontis TaxID=525918 RepID=A0A1H4GNU0_9GAMM|nr:hypothetical protein [Thiothrix caldifontis]SEB10508.1 hypothetical protein SAMN05660964_03563 [Thiothrix caldifontis]